MSRNVIIKTAAFTLILVYLLAAASRLVTSPRISTTFELNYQRIQGFYTERENSLDAVCIGGSNVYCFWEAPLAWGNYGIAVYPFATNAQPFAAAEYMIKEARKTQPDALYIVVANISNLKFVDSYIHSATDYLKESLNKYQLINALSDWGGYGFSKRLEFFFPILRYHSRWSDLKEEDFSPSLNGLKGGLLASVFLEEAVDVSESFRKTVQRTTLEAQIQEPLDALLDYCDTENVNILFVIVPQAGADELFPARCNTVMELIEARGYPALNMLDDLDKIGIDLRADFYNENHTNIHGAAKITDYLSRYLLEHYHLQDRRGDPSYDDWDRSYDNYLEGIAPYSLDFEYTNANRNYSLAAPELMGSSVDGTTLTLIWNKVEEADGYCIYRKTAQSGWVRIAAVDADTLTYRDKDREIDKEYTYTVASYQEKDGTRYWGNYDFNGLS